MKNVKKHPIIYFEIAKVLWKERGWHWFTKDWWNFLLAKKDSDYSWFEVIWCRLRSHPAGVWWYNPWGFEPDMHCKGCGDNLG